MSFKSLALSVLMVSSIMGLPAYAHPHDHECVGPVDENCFRGGPSGDLCDVYVESSDAEVEECLSPAHPRPARGFLCGFTSEFDPTLEGDTQTGEIDGGPLVNEANPGGDIYLKCTIQVGSQGATHAGADSTGVADGTGAGVVVIPPTVVRYVGPFGLPVYLCSEVRLGGAGGTPLYWDSTNGEFSSSSGVDCGLALYQDGGVSGRCSITGDNGLRLLCRMDNGQLCLIWLDGTCLVPLPL